MVYLDSCIAIYLIEEHEQYLPAIDRHLADDIEICISDLVVLECLVKPLRDKNEPLIAKFKNEFEGFVTLQLSSDVYVVAAKLRAEFGIKVPDALHLACALHHGCTEFWTNDDRLNKVAVERNLRVVNLTQTS